MTEGSNIEASKLAGLFRAHTRDNKPVYDSEEILFAALVEVIGLEGVFEQIFGLVHDYDARSGSWDSHCHKVRMDVSEHIEWLRGASDAWRVA